MLNQWANVFTLVRKFGMVSYFFFGQTSKCWRCEYLPMAAAAPETEKPDGIDDGSLEGIS